MKRSIIYARVSYAKRRDEKVSIEAQIEQSRALAARLDAAVDRVFIDDGRSAWHGNRPAFEDALDYCDALDVDYFITWSTSRFSRNRIRAALDKDRLEQAGVTVKYVSSPIDRETDEGWLLDGIYELFDEHQSRGISRDTTRSMIKNAREGYWNGGRPPLGYRSMPAPDNPKKKRLAIDEAEARLVRRIFKLRLEGHGGLAIARALNDQGATNRGRPWNKATVLNLLSNETLRGNIVFNRRDRKDKKRTRPRSEWIVVPCHQAIIDDQTWNDVQELLERSNPTTGTRAGRGQHAFTGLLSCGVCGAPMRTASSNGMGGQYYYYQCSAVYESKAHRSNRIRADLLDKWLTDSICNQVFDRKTITSIVNDMRELVGNWARERDGRRRVIVGELQSAERASSKIYELFELHGKDAPNLKDLTVRLRQHRQIIDACEARLESLDSERPPQFDPDDKFIEDLVGFLRAKVVNSEKPSKLQAFFSSFIERIEVHADQVIFVYFPDRLVPKVAPGGSVLTKETWLPGTDSNCRQGG